jgi:hypothetical protein
MSRYYRMEIDVIPLAEDTPEFQEMCGRIGDWMEINGHTDVGLGISFFGEGQLGGGESPDDAHERFKKALPNKMLRSRWLCLDREWDHEFDDVKEDEDEECDVPST